MEAKKDQVKTTVAAVGASKAPGGADIPNECFDFEDYELENLAQMPSMDQKSNSGVNPESSVAEEEVSICAKAVRVSPRQLYVCEAITKFGRRLTDYSFVIV